MLALGGSGRIGGSKQTGFAALDAALSALRRSLEFSMYYYMSAVTINIRG
jgi:hypothetical protein